MDALEGILPALPFVIITSTEGYYYFAGKKSFNTALINFAERTGRSAFMMGADGLVYLLDGGLLSIPASFASGMVFDYYYNLNEVHNELPKQFESIRGLRLQP